MKRRQVTDKGAGGAPHAFRARVESLMDHVQDLDRARLLEPTSLPKVLRGRPELRRPKTAIIAYAAQAAYERRMACESVGIIQTVNKFFRQRDAKLQRIADKLRAGWPT